jgi:AcrR family transcriptional regulator
MKRSVPSRASDPARRGRILAAAEKLFRHYGPAKTTIGDIARETGIGVGSVYLEFDSKDAIVSELSTRRHDRVLDAMRAAASTGKCPERLCKALEARLETLFDMSDEGAHACDLVLCSASAVKTVHGRFREEEMAFVAELLAAGARAGELEVNDARGAAELIQRAYASLSPPWLFELSRREALRQARAMNTLLLRGLLSNRARKDR